jgi:uncharacterized membrane protein
MRLAAPLLALLLLAACNRTEEASSPPPPADTPSLPPPMAVSDFPGDFNAIGTEPFWGVEIRKEALTLTRPDSPPLALPNPGPAIENGRGVWKTEPFTLTLSASVCNDGMSDRTYPYTADLLLDGQPLQGCAGRPEMFNPGAAE